MSHFPAVYHSMSESLPDVIVSSVESQALLASERLQLKDTRAEQYEDLLRERMQQVATFAFSLGRSTGAIEARKAIFEGGSRHE